MSDFDLVRRIAALERMLESLLMTGTVSELDEVNARVRVSCGELETGWLPWFTRRAGGDCDWWAPEVGEQVMLLSPGGDPQQGAALPAIYQTAYPAPADSKNVRRVVFSDGTVIEYDRAAHLLTANVAGNTTLKTTLATIDGALHVTGEITGDKSLVVTQDVADQGGAKTMSGMRDVHNQHTHDENGDGGGTTDEPNQQM